MHFSLRCSHVIQNEDDSPFKKTAKFLGQQKTHSQNNAFLLQKKIFGSFFIERLIL